MRPRVSYDPSPGLHRERRSGSGTETNTDQRIKTHFTEDMDGLLDSMRRFGELFELVFDVDWETTQTCIRNSEHAISQDGTFNRPMVDDGRNKWWNLGAFWPATAT